MFGTPQPGAKAVGLALLPKRSGFQAVERTPAHLLTVWLFRAPS